MDNDGATAISLVEETPDYLVINKPPGLVTQGANAGANLLARVKSLYSMASAYPVHRLDADTSGLVIIAKTSSANSLLSRCFQDQKIQKLYLALVDRKPIKKQGRIIGDMSKSRDGNWRLQRSRLNPAVTDFVSFGIGEGYRLMLLKPKTGRTHQLRVALKSVAAPIVGDRRYGGAPADRLYLHAWQLVLPWGGELRRYRAPLTSGAHFMTPQFSEALARAEDTVSIDNVKP